MIIEGLLTTTALDGSPHIAPMGPIVDESLQHWLLRPFQSSQTFSNLRREGQCVFHVVDDALIVAQSALSVPSQLQYSKSPSGGWIMDSACHWYCLETMNWNLEEFRSEVTARVVETGFLRPFWGWNRAKHAVLEATILATRLQLTGPQPILEEMQRLQPIIDKTAGPRELAAWDLVFQHVHNPD